MPQRSGTPNEAIVFNHAQTRIASRGSRPSPRHSNESTRTIRRTRISEQGEVEAREHRRVPHREGGERRGARDHEPDLVAVPDAARSTRTSCGGRARSARGRAAASRLRSRIPRARSSPSRRTRGGRTRGSRASSQYAGAGSGAASPSRSVDLGRIERGRSGASGRSRRARAPRTASTKTPRLSPTFQVLTVPETASSVFSSP